MNQVNRGKISSPVKTSQGKKKKGDRISAQQRKKKTKGTQWEGSLNEVCKRQKNN